MVCQVFDFIVEALEGCSITMAKHPGHNSTCATIKGFLDPKLVFLNPQKQSFHQSIFLILSDFCVGPLGSGLGNPTIYQRAGVKNLGQHR